MEPLNLDIDLLRQFQSLLVVLGIGLLLGLEREQAYHLKEGKHLFAGIRTFPIVAVLGYLGAFMGTALSVWAFFGVLLGVFAIVAISFLRAESAVRGTTTEFSLILVFVLGGMVQLGHAHLSVGIAIAVTALLTFKIRLHNLAGALSKEEFLSILQFLLVTALVLPLLPDQNIGPYGFFNAYKTGLILSIFLTLNFAGYFLSRFFEERSTFLTGVLGGLASSTATAWYFSRRVGEGKGSGSREAGAVVLASFAELGLVPCTCPSNFDAGPDRGAHKFIPVPFSAKRNPFSSPRTRQSSQFSGSTCLYPDLHRHSVGRGLCFCSPWQYRSVLGCRDFRFCRCGCHYRIYVGVWK